MTLQARILRSNAGLSHQASSRDETRNNHENNKVREEAQQSDSQRARALEQPHDCIADVLANFLAMQSACDTERMERKKGKEKNSRT